MTPGQFLARIGKQVPPAVLLLGPETYGRGRIKSALSRLFPESGAARFDLAESPLSEAIDDARSLSLFATERLIWISNAEAALPRGRGAEESGESTGGADFARSASADLRSCRRRAGGRASPGGRSARSKTFLQ